MLLKKSMLLLTFLFVSSSAISQISLKKVIITGKIIDKETTKPIEFAVITISKSDTKKVITGGTSDANGNFNWVKYSMVVTAPSASVTFEIQTNSFGNNKGKWTPQ